MKTIRVLISQELLLKFIQQCNHVHMTVTKGLPRECKIVGLRRAVVSGNFEIQVHVPDSFSGEDESGIFLPEITGVECAFCSGPSPSLDSGPEGSDRAPGTVPGTKGHGGAGTVAINPAPPKGASTVAQSSKSGSVDADDS